MNPLHDCVARLADGGPVDTVLHVGPADASLLERYLALWPRQVVWVDDDAERVVALREAAAAAGAASLLTVIAACVDAQAGERTWQHFDVPAFDGPLPLHGVAAAYPALPAPTTRRVSARAFEPLVAGVLGALPAPARAVLAIDQPGRERALLASLGADTLARVSTLLLRGCSRPFFAGGSTLDDTLAALSRRSWRVRVRGTGLPWWPAVALQFDAEIEALAARLAESESKRLAAEARNGEIAGLRADVSQRDAALAQRDDALARLRDQNAALQKDAATLKQGIAHRDATIAQRDASLAARAAEWAQARKDEAALRQELARSQAAVTLRNDTLVLRAETLAQREADIKRRDADLKRLEAEVASWKAELARRDQLHAVTLEKAVTARDTCARERADLMQQREKQTAALQESQRQVHRLEGAATTTAAHQRLLQDALSQAEGQLALVRDLLLRD
jgi:hypothetical protein